MVDPPARTLTPESNHGRPVEKSPLHPQNANGDGDVHTVRPRREELVQLPRRDRTRTKEAM
eukprot:4753064-Prymnesium_polylepis.1